MGGGSAHLKKPSTYYKEKQKNQIFVHFGDKAIFCVSFQLGRLSLREFVCLFVDHEIIFIA